MAKITLDSWSTVSYTEENEVTIKRKTIKVWSWNSVKSIKIIVKEGEDEEKLIKRAILKEYPVLAEKEMKTKEEKRIKEVEEQIAKEKEQREKDIAAQKAEKPKLKETKK